ncbi:MAG: neutral/alkaline non-lysosomal ceramidase N-terminal domain-containing protein [Bryobacterales bacterium]|nr:neutral/alkaline non-lysosomal ceramidase N-terminal domain-containing protein [Bryobacterales bacterium]
MRLLLVVAGLLPALLLAKGFEAGVGRVDITPTKPIWLSGYASRTHESDGVLLPISAKALALSDGRSKVVIVTMDLVGFSQEFADVVTVRAMKAYDLPRASLMLNASHTHTGPVVGRNLLIMYNLTPVQEARIHEYTAGLEEKIVWVIGSALGQMRPVTIEFGQTEAGFAMNRRQPAASGFTNGANPKGPTDHTVPVFEVKGADGKPMAVLFGYACHNTTLTGQIYEISGDYAGFAQKEVEDAHPGAIAMFMQLCGADQNPLPRGTVELARKYGHELGGQVNAVLADSTRRKKVAPKLKAVFRQTELTFAHRSRQDYEKELASNDSTARKRAKAMLANWDDKLVRRLPYPVQAIRFGNGPVLLALGGEVVVDYSLRAKREYPKTDLIVAGYSNVVPCYIPSLRVLKEGGYEGGGAMLYYGQPGPFDETVEETIFSAIHKVMKDVK